MDSLLRCAPAPRSRSSIRFHSCLCPCPCLFPCFLYPCRCANRVCCPWSPSCLLSCLRHLSCHSSIHQLLFHDATLQVPSDFPCLFPCRLCTLSRQWRTHLRVTCHCPCRSRSASSSCRACRRSPDPWSVVSHHLVHDDLQFLHNFVKFSRSRQEFPLDVFGIISLTTNTFCASSIVLNWCSYSATFSDHAVSLSFSSFASLHLLGVANMACSAWPSTNACHATNPRLGSV